MYKKDVLTIAAVAILALAIGQVQAGTVPIDNPGFEDSVVADGEYDYSLDNQGWGYFDNGGELGQWNPGLPGTSEPGYGGNAPEGQNVGWANPGGVGVPGGFAQVLTDADATLRADMAYTLTVEVGNTPRYPWSGYKVQLLVGGIPHTPGTGGDNTGPVTGGTLLAEDNNSMTIAEDTFETSTVTYTYDPELHSGLLGEPLQIRLLSLGNVAAGDYTEVNYDNVTLSYEVTTIARNPTPADGAGDVLATTTLSWTPGQGAAAHDVYLGEVFADVNEATRTDDHGVLVEQGQDATTYDPPGDLEFDRTYYWRVDEVDGAPGNTIHKGNVWSFTVEPLGRPIEGVIASSNGIHDEGVGPEKTVDGSGLNELDQHSINGGDMWSDAPGDDSVSVVYEFDNVYKLHEMLVWNYNHMLESVLGFGFKDVTIEHSENGTDWTVLGDVEFARAPGAPDYTADTIVAFDGVAAKYVRLTANSGWGTLPTPQFGLSEVRFLYIPAQAREPQPDDGAADVSVATQLAWRAGRDAVSYEVNFGTDPDVLDLVGTVDAPSFDPGTLDLETTYDWRVDAVQEVDSWEGRLWSFATQAFLVVDDFESYTDDIDAGDTIFDAWIDGYGIDENGSVVGHGQAPFAEQGIVNNGAQSMPLFYDNDTASVAEAELTLAQDWTASGIKNLLLYFHGAADNTGELYVKINGQEVLYDGDAADIAVAQWQPWNIDLSTVGGDISDVTSLIIGIKGAGVTGVVYIDDIRLYPDAPAGVDSVIYSFDDLPDGGDACDGIHAGIDFGSGNWWGGDNWYGMTQCGYFSDDFVDVPMSFTLPENAHLLSIALSADDAYSYTISDGVNADIVGTTGTAPEVINTNWSSGGSAITITTAGGWYVVFDDITYITSD